LKERIIGLVKELKNVKFLRLDNAGENFALEKLSKQQNVDVKFEFWAQGHLKEMERWKESSRHFREEFVLCLMMLVLKVIFTKVNGLNAHLRLLFMTTLL
jgi:hypothetical protein